MPTYSMRLIDSYYLAMGRSLIRYDYRVNVEKESSTQSWRQVRPFNSTYFKTAAGSWRRMKLWSRIEGIAFESGQHAALVLPGCRSGNIADFPCVGQWGTGILHEAGDAIAYPAHNVLWAIESGGGGGIDPRNIWIGGGGKYGGMVPVWGREAMHGWVVNLADPTRRCYIQAETTRWGVGLGGGGGAVLLIVTGPNPVHVLNKVSGSWDFSLSIAGRWDTYIKAIAKGGQYAKYLELGNFAIQVYNRCGVIHREAFENAANHAKLLVSSSGIDCSSPGITALDVAGAGLEATVCFAKSKVTMVRPL